MPRSRGLQPRLPAPFTGTGFASIRFDSTGFQAMVPFFQDLLDRFQYGSPQRDAFLRGVGRLGENHLRDVYQTGIGPTHQWPTEDTGFFGASIVHDIVTGPSVDQLRVTIVSRGVPYAAYLEEGSPPQPVSYQDIREWAANKGFVFQNPGHERAVVSKIVGDIREHGTAPRYLYSEAFQEGSPTAQYFFDEVEELATQFLRDELDF